MPKMRWWRCTRCALSATTPLRPRLTLPCMRFFLSSTRSEERRVGKECRSLCDWSSDVCSSDLAEDEMVEMYPLCAFGNNAVAASIDTPLHAFLPFKHKIGRASCRERV